MKKRRRMKTTTLEDAMVSLKEWWLEEKGSDASMSLRAKIRLWVERGREHGARP